MFTLDDVIGVKRKWWVWLISLSAESQNQNLIHEQYISLKYQISCKKNSYPDGFARWIHKYHIADYFFFSPLNASHHTIYYYPPSLPLFIYPITQFPSHSFHAPSRGIFLFLIFHNDFKTSRLFNFGIHDMGPTRK